MNYDTKSILEMGNGAFLERADYEMQKIIKNIRDPNTKPDAKRKITMTLTFLPDYDRQNIDVAFDVKSTPAAVSTVDTTLYIAGEDANGTPQVVEMAPQIPGQMGLDGNEQEHPPMLRLVE